MKKTILFSLWMVVFLLSGCVSAEVSGPQSASGDPVEAATPTAEVFIPLDPSPTTVESNMPQSCQVTDLNVFSDEAAGYCFAYPNQFRLDESISQVVSLVGPALDQNVDPLLASLGVEIQPVPDNSDLGRLVDAYLSQSGFHNLPWTIERSSLNLAGEPAVKLEPVPGRGSSRLVMALHGGHLYTLRFGPVDQEMAMPDLEALYQTVTGSFAFFDGTGGSQPGSETQTASWNEFGQVISMSYDAMLAPWVEALSLPAVSPSSNEPFFGIHPAYADFRFLGFQGGRIYQLPFVPDFDNQVAHIAVFQTADFPGYGDETYFGFPGQLQLLSDLLQNGVDPSRCTEPMYDYEQSLPFLPWVNSKQTFCAQPEILDFQSGKGLRYLTYYSQGMDPVLDSLIFFTFQGLSADGKYYISASFPVATGIFPDEPPEGALYPDPAFLDTMKEQVTQLNAQGADHFEPSLSTLDALVASIRIGAP